jgi:cobalamin biosynthesis Mg chelatase CobN
MNILRGLKAQGYTVGSLPETSQDLMETVLNGLTNDRRWLSSENSPTEHSQKTPSKQYAQWFKELPKEVSDKVLKDWGHHLASFSAMTGTCLSAGSLRQSFCWVAASAWVFGESLRHLSQP